MGMLILIGEAVNACDLFLATACRCSSVNRSSGGGVGPPGAGVATSPESDMSWVGVVWVGWVGPPLVQWEMMMLDLNALGVNPTVVNQILSV